MGRMHHRVPDIYHARFSATATPAITIESGDSVAFRTPDVSWGVEPPVSTTSPRRKIEHTEPGPCLCGPVAVRGAEPGDALEIDIEHLRPGPWGWTYAGGGMSTPELNSALGIAGAPLALLRWTLDDQRRAATNQLGHSVAVRPFLGIMGLAPAGEPACAWTPRACGGNMDCRELVAGSKLFLPVEVEGGLLSVGDGHAAQGDGELSGTAVECMMEEARLRVTIRKGLRITGPRIRAADAWITLGFGQTLDQAAAAAASAMLDLMTAQLGLPRAEALALASARVHLRITQMVNPGRGVHAVLHDAPLF